MKLAALLLWVFPIWAQSTGSLEGIVVNSLTGAGIGGVVVGLNLVQEAYRTTTDASGRFQISGITPGDYDSFVYKDAFTLVSTPPSIHVSPGAPTRLRFELLPPATLRGHVYGIDGEPLAHIRVEAGGSDAAGPTGSQATTDEDGAFALENLTPGPYSILVWPPAANASFMRGGTRMEIRPTYFPSVLDPAAARDISVESGDDKSGIDIRLQASPVHRVRGVVLDAERKPAVRVVVEAIPKGAFGVLDYSADFGRFFIAPHSEPIFRVPMESTGTGPDGVFEFPSLPTGEWVLRSGAGLVSLEEGVERYRFYGTATASVRDSDIGDLQIRLAPTFDLNVRFEWSDGSPASNIRPSARLLSSNDAFPDRFAGGPIEHLPPQRYRIRTTGFGNYYASRIMIGGTDVTGQTVDIPSSSPAIRVILRPGGTLRGTVKQCGQGVVIVWPQSTLPGDAGKSALCGAGGAFEMRGLPPGEYYAVAVDRYEPREMTTAAYLRGVISKAASVRVEEGATASLDLSLTR
ncbi:MAG TPA: carboxypeptidase-like regulatory domain-containing protein [Bryobacteraceae bacterium]|jgi:hypothetical protein